jgi:hypothetical protein
MKTKDQVDVYTIYRFYFRKGKRKILTDLTLEEAQSYCSDHNTSSSTCTSVVGRRRTKIIGPWFDGYTCENM